MDGRREASGACSGEPEAWGAALYRVVVPRQELVVRLNGLDPDALEEDYLPTERPYGVGRMAWAIWREVPWVGAGEALALARRVRRKGEAEVLVAARSLAEHVRGMLRSRHHLSVRLDPVC